MSILPLAAMIILHYGQGWSFPTWSWVIFIIIAFSTPIVKVKKEE